MADLTQFTQTGKTDPTVTAIYEAIKANTSYTPRRYLGASIIGKSCARQLWYDFRWVSFEDFDGRLLRLFNTGHLEEPRLVKNLREAGLTVHDFDPTTGKQFAVIYHGGHFRGHADGVALGIKDAPKTWHLLEFKTHNQKSFDKLCNEGLQKTKPEHYDQIQVYMLGLELTRGYYLARNKNTDELYGERVKFDKAYAKGVIERARRIIFANEPPMRVSERPDWFECKFCHYHKYCHVGATDLPDPLPNVNCRTCIHSTPTNNGKWLCESYHDEIPEDWQIKGCDRHRYIPMLLPNLEFTTADQVIVEGGGVYSNSVFYRSNSGVDYINNGKGSIVSLDKYRGEILCTN